MLRGLELIMSVSDLGFSNARMGFAYQMSKDYATSNG